MSVLASASHTLLPPAGEGAPGLDPGADEGQRTLR